MQGPLLIIASICLTILSWGLYGPTLHRGQDGMALVDGEFARLRPLMCVGLAYFLIAVIVPTALLWTRGEKGKWTLTGSVTSLLAGCLGAGGALGIITAFTFGGRPSYVMPLVFGGAPVVNAFITIFLAKKLKEIGPVFLAGLLMVVMGAVVVLIFKPAPHKHVDPTLVEKVETVDSPPANKNVPGGNLALQILATCGVMLCWGSYGPVLHKGQAAMGQSKLRPLLCVGLSYFLIAVLVPWMLLGGPVDEASEFNWSGTLWSLGGGALGAFGALGIIMAFTFGGRPVYVMPLVFGGAPVITTIEALTVGGGLQRMTPIGLGGFLAGLMLVIAGAALVLIFAPKGGPPKQAPVDDKPAESRKGPDRSNQRQEAPAPFGAPKS